MKTFPVMLAPLLLVVSFAAAWAADEPPIDVARGKQLMRKFQAGETLTPEEQAYLESLVSITPICASPIFPAVPSAAGRGARAAALSPTPTNPASAHAGSCRVRFKVIHN